MLPKKRKLEDGSIGIGGTGVVTNSTYVIVWDFYTCEIHICKTSLEKITTVKTKRKIVSVCIDNNHSVYVCMYYYTRIPRYDIEKLQFEAEEIHTKDKLYPIFCFINNNQNIVCIVNSGGVVTVPYSDIHFYDTESKGFLNKFFYSIGDETDLITPNSIQQNSRGDYYILDEQFIFCYDQTFQFLFKTKLEGTIRTHTSLYIDPYDLLYTISVRDYTIHVYDCDGAVMARVPVDNRHDIAEMYRQKISSRGTSMIYANRNRVLFLDIPHGKE